MGKLAKAKKPFRDAFENESGLVLQYKPYILKRSKEYSNRYQLPHKFFIGPAIEIARRAEQKFDPSRNNGFVAYLDSCLQGLNRIARRFYKDRRDRRKPKPEVLKKWQIADRRRERIRESERQRGLVISWRERQPFEFEKEFLIGNREWGPRADDTAGYMQWKKEHAGDLVQLADELASELIRQRDPHNDAGGSRHWHHQGLCEQTRLQNYPYDYDFRGLSAGRQELSGPISEEDGQKLMFNVGEFPVMGCQP